MKAKKIPRTEGSYVLLLDSLQKSSDVQNIDLLFVSMKKEAVRATDIFYSKIIAAYGHCGAFDKVCTRPTIQILISIRSGMF